MQTVYYIAYLIAGVPATDVISSRTGYHVIRQQVRDKYTIESAPIYAGETAEDAVNLLAELKRGEGGKAK